MRHAGLVAFYLSSLISGACAQSAKLPLLGLVDKGPDEFYNFGESGGSPYPEPFNSAEVSVTDANGATQPLPFAGMVLNVTWDQLEHVQNKFDFSFITTYFAALDAYNASFATYPGFVPLRVKLRIWAGFTAPSWAQKLDHGPMQINQSPLFTVTPQKGPIGLWWAKDYIPAWRSLLQHVATSFDGDPHVAEVAVTSCMHPTDEPFAGWYDTATLNIMFGHGYTDKQEQSCLSNALVDYQYWKQTPIDFTFNVYQTISKGFLGIGYNVSSNQPLTQSIMDGCRKQGCGLDNHSLADPLDTGVQFVYDYIAEYPTAPAEFQTRSPATLPDLCTAVTLGVQTYHARSIEIWPDVGGYQSWPMTGPKSMPTCTAALSTSILTGTAVDATQCPVSACPSQ